MGVHYLAAGDILRVRGRDSGPRRRRTPPPGTARTRPRGMSPAGGNSGRARATRQRSVSSTEATNSKAS